MLGHAQSLQGVGDPVAALLELAVGHGPRGADERRVVATGPRELGEHLGQRRREGLAHDSVTPASSISCSAAVVDVGATPAHSDVTQRRLEAVAYGVQGRRAHAVVGGEAAHVDVRHLAGAQPVGQARAVRGGALEAGVGRGVLTLEEDRVERLRVEVGVEGLTVRPDHAVRRPRVREVGVLAEVVARVDVVVTGGDRDVVGGRPRVPPGPVVQQVADAEGHLGAPLDRQAAALAEVVLDVDHDQCALHPATLVPRPARVTRHAAVRS